MKLNKMLLTAGFAAILALGTCNVIAQDGPPGGGQGGPGGGQGGPGGPGGMDFSQMRQRMIDRYREQLEVKDDAEWKVLEGQITKVMEARMETMSGMGRGFGMMRPPRNGNTNSPAGAARGNRPRGPMGQQSAAAEALQKALDAKAPAAEIKTKLEAYRAEVKAKEDKLAKAQEELKKLLTPQQEAIAVLNGLLK